MDVVAAIGNRSELERLVQSYLGIFNFPEDLAQWDIYRVGSLVEMTNAVGDGYVFGSSVSGEAYVAELQDRLRFINDRLIPNTGIVHKTKTDKKNQNRVEIGMIAFGKVEAG